MVTYPEDARCVGHETGYLVLASTGKLAQVCYIPQLWGEKERGFIKKSRRN